MFVSSAGEIPPDALTIVPTGSRRMYGASCSASPTRAFRPSGIVTNLSDESSALGVRAERVVVDLSRRRLSLDVIDLLPDSICLVRARAHGHCRDEKRAESNAH